jgi:hypothetical protein
MSVQVSAKLSISRMTKNIGNTREVTHKSAPVVLHLQESHMKSPGFQLEAIAVQSQCLATSVMTQPSVMDVTNDNISILSESS